jgi:hypothetical protein
VSRKNTCSSVEKGEAAFLFILQNIRYLWGNLLFIFMSMEIFKRATELAADDICFETNYLQCFESGSLWLYWIHNIILHSFKRVLAYNSW